MIKLYLSPSCSSCRKVKKYFIDQKIPFKEINILSHEISLEELKDMLSKSENGTDDIISKRSKIIKEGNIDVDSMSLNELLDFIKANPTILKRPIILSDNILQVGYNADDIEIFEKAKRIASLACQSCPDYEGCEHPFKLKK